MQSWNFNRWKDITTVLFLINWWISVNTEDQNLNLLSLLRKLSFQLSENYLLIIFEKFLKWFHNGRYGCVCIVEVACAANSECVSRANIGKIKQNNVNDLY